MSPALRDMYGGGLDFPNPPERPYVIANFVETLDGVVSFGLPGRSGGGEVSGFSVSDQFVMGLLRACADAVVFASGTLHGDAGHVRTPEFIYPDAAPLFAALRARIAPRRPLPLNVVVTGSGRIDIAEPTFHTPGLETLIVTTDGGRRALEAEHGKALQATQVRTVGTGDEVAPLAVTRLLHEEFGVRLLLHEGGPTFLGSFLAAGAVDELFLTVAPQIAGRDASGRRALAEGTAFLPESAPWFGLETVKRAGDHLFLRLSRSARIRPGADPSQG